MGLFTEYRWAGVAIVVLALLSWIGVDTVRIANAEASLARCQAGRASDRAFAAAAAASQTEAYRAEEQRRTAAQQKVVDDTERKLVQVRTDAALADAASGRLQQRVAAIAAEARQAARDPSPSAGGPPAEDAVGLLAELQRRADEAAGILARIADERGAAGAACVAAYDSLTEVTP